MCVVFPGVLGCLYSLFCSWNPNFEKHGKVSIVSHSLGCVITFDIMTGWDPVHLHHQEVPNPEKTKIHWPSDEEGHVQEQLRLTRLRYCTHICLETDKECDTDFTPIKKSGHFCYQNRFNKEFRKLRSL